MIMLPERHYLTAIPFPGLYHSILDSIIDSEIESDAYNRCEDASNEGDESSYPESIRLDESDVCGAYFASGVSDFPAAHWALARDYLAAFDEELTGHLGFKTRLQFESMNSPRFYNFETDTLYAWIPHSTMRLLARVMESESYAVRVRERHSHRSGFISSYSNDPEHYREKYREGGPAALDHNEIETVLQAAIREAGYFASDTLADPVDEIQSRAEMEVNESWSGNCGFAKFVDWDALESVLADKRAAKLPGDNDGRVAVLSELLANYREGFDGLIAAIERARVAA
jgi:general stress protein YciG